MSFSYFSSPESYIKDEIDKRKGNILYTQVNLIFGFGYI